MGYVAENSLLQTRLLAKLLGPGSRTQMHFQVGFCVLVVCNFMHQLAKCMLTLLWQWHTGIGTSPSAPAVLLCCQEW